MRNYGYLTSQPCALIHVTKVCCASYKLCIYKACTVYGEILEDEIFMSFASNITLFMKKS